jgi:hypothetical protein
VLPWLRSVLKRAIASDDKCVEKAEPWSFCWR